MIIAGAGGHAQEVLDILIRSGMPKQDIFFYDDLNVDKLWVHAGFKVLKDTTQLSEVLKLNPFFCLGIGAPAVRKKMTELFQLAGGTIKSVRGNNIVSDFSKPDQSVDIMDYAFVGPNSWIGRGTLINTRASVHHDVTIGEYCEISPGATLLGGVQVGSYCRVGAASVILPGVKVGSGVVIAAGAVVNKDLPDHVVVAGVPARIIKTVDLLS